MMLCDCFDVWEHNLVKWNSNKRIYIINHWSNIGKYKISIQETWLDNKSQYYNKIEYYNKEKMRKW
jgi:hypothetical protein